MAHSNRPRGTKNKRLYAIGDVHGRYDLLMDLLTRISDHSSARAQRETSIVLLGDLIDRGPNSAKVIEFVRNVRPSDFRFYALMGNHEELMLNALAGDLGSFQTWLRNGGRETAASYGLTEAHLDGLPPEGTLGELIKAVPPAHLTLIKSFADSIRFGDYLLVHAGLRPGIELSRQSPRDLRWIRGPFLESSADHGFVVVHGHSATLEIEERSNRIGIDTGAYETGILTAIWIEDDERGFLQTEGR